MQRRVAQTFGILVAILAVGGFFVKDDHLLGLMNADMWLDLTRVIIAAALLYAGFGRASASSLRGSLIALGVLYIGMGVLGLIDSELFGILPTGLTGFDIAFHIGSGLLALWAGIAKNSDHDAVNA
jgi:hypothetical protein